MPHPHPATASAVPEGRARSSSQVVILRPWYATGRDQRNPAHDTCGRNLPWWQSAHCDRVPAATRVHCTLSPATTKWHRISALVPELVLRVHGGTHRAFGRG